MQKTETEPLSYTFQKLTQNGLKNMRSETIKLLEENIGSNFFYNGCSNIFLDMLSQARETKAKINYPDYPK